MCEKKVRKMCVKDKCEIYVIHLLKMLEKIGRNFLGSKNKFLKGILQKSSKTILKN